MYKRLTQDLPRGLSVRKEGEARCCVPPRRSRGLRARGDPQKGLRVCRCGNRSEPGSRFRDWPSARGRRGKKGDGILHRRFSSLRLPFLCSTSGKLPCRPAAVPQTATLPSNGFCLLVPLTKTLLFQRLFFHLRKAGAGAPSPASAEARLLTNLYSQRTPDK